MIGHVSSLIWVNHCCLKLQYWEHGGCWWPGASISATIMIVWASCCISEVSQCNEYNYGFFFPNSFLLYFKQWFWSHEIMKWVNNSSSLAIMCNFFPVKWSDFSPENMAVLWVNPWGWNAKYTAIKLLISKRCEHSYYCNSKNVHDIIFIIVIGHSKGLVGILYICDICCWFDSVHHITLFQIILFITFDKANNWSQWLATFV